jgi:hypothetical protein
MEQTRESAQRQHRDQQQVGKHVRLELMRQVFFVDQGQQHGLQ